jgi:ABC-type Fe3+ transport system permease subunit
MKIKISNVSAWSAVTALAVTLGYAGYCLRSNALIYASVVVWCVIGVVDLIRIKQGDMTISSRIREASPKWLTWPIIILAIVGAFLIGGWPLLVFALINFLVGHWWG